jgi:hypothetical protein
MPIAVAEEAVIPDLNKAFGQNMLQETPDELFGGDSTVPGCPGVRVLVAKGHLIIFHFQDAIVTDRNPKDIGSQILQSSYSAADGLAMNHPIFLPRLGRDQIKQAGLLQSIAELGPEQDGEWLNVHQEIPSGRQPTLTIRSQSTGGHHIVDVGMVAEVAGPGVEYPDHANLAADKARVLGQLLQGSRGRAKQDIIDDFLVTSG